MRGVGFYIGAGVQARSADFLPKFSQLSQDAVPACEICRQKAASSREQAVVLAEMQPPEAVFHWTKYFHEPPRTLWQLWDFFTGG